jgi:TPR repeat protein
MARSPIPAPPPRRRVMRTSNVIASLGLLGLALGLSPAASFDGTRAPEGATVAVPLPGGNGAAGADLGRATPLAAVPGAALGNTRPATPFDAYRSGSQALRQGRTAQALSELEYAAEQGVPAALWKLGRMYADGDGVERNALRAFEYFSRLTKTHGDDAPTSPQAAFVAKAFVALGQYYLSGVPNSSVSQDPVRAREMYWYAASYFADADAQYHLGRLYLDRSSGARDPRQAAKWLGLAARKGQPQAQALLGAMLFRGDGVTRQAALGLFWLTLAQDGAEPPETWINESYASALGQATDDERAMAYNYLESWLRGRRE